MYSATISRSTPGCIVFLLDQSGSMASPFGAAQHLTLAQGAAQAINKVLYDLCLRAIKEPGAAPRHYFDIGVFGYGGGATATDQQVVPALQGQLAGRPLVPITDVATYPLDVREVQEHADAPASRKPVWFEPVAGFGTPMCEAIAVAGGHVHDWVKDHPASFPPIVINITDGVVTDDPFQNAGLAEWASRLTGLTTADGNVLLFNIFLSSIAAPVSYFPATGQHLPEPGPALFAMASELPEPMVRNARALGVDIGPGGRGLVFNADMDALATFLEIGTRPTIGAAADR